MSRFNKYLLPVLAIVGLAFLWLIKSNLDFESNKKLTDVVFPLSDCKPQQEKCTIKNDEFEFEVVFDKDIFYLKPFSVFVQKKGSNATEIASIQIDFKMIGMNMGVNRFNLEKKDNAIKGISWVGKPVLPVCISARVDWTSEIEIVSGDKKYIYAFPMRVVKANP